MRKIRKPLLFLLALALVLVLSRCFGWDTLLSGEGLALLREGAAENLPLAALLYLLLTVVGCVVLALPGVTFAVIAGTVFGPWLGTVLCLGATTLGAMAAFLAGRYFLADAIRPLVMKNAPLKRLLFDEAGRSAAWLLMLTRLVPLFPYNLQNFAYGITDVPFSLYSLYTLVFIAPGVAAFTFGAAGLTSGTNGWLYGLIALGLALGVFLLSRRLKKEVSHD